MSASQFCHNCGQSLESSWLACVSCGQPKFGTKPTKCPSCSLIINHESPSFCPYCVYSFAGKTAIKVKPIADVKTKEKKKPELIITNKQSITRDTFKHFLRFNSDASTELLQSNSFKYRAYQLMIISAMFSSLVLVGINILFATDSDTPLRRVIENYILWANGFFMVMFGFCIAYTFVMSRIQRLLGYNMVARYTGGIAISFIIKDVFVLLLAVYVYVFEGNSGLNLALLGFWVMSSIFLVYFIIHAMVLTKQMYGTGVFLSLLIISAIFGVVYVLTFYSTIVLTQILYIIR